MRVQVSKVFAKFVNDAARERGVRLSARVDERRPGMFEDFDERDYDWTTGNVRKLVVSYPAEYYACEQCVGTAELLKEFRRRRVKTWDELKEMVIDMFQI